MMDTPEESSSIQDRLLRLRKTVQKATQEAFHQATLGDDEAAVLENDDPNASFHLGMELFGNDPSVVERNIQSRLSEMEEELEDVMTEIQSKAQQQQQSTSPSSSSPDASTTDRPPRVPTPEERTRQEGVLRAKIDFLRRCSRIRVLLDEALTSSTPALSPTSVDRVRAAHKVVEAHGVWDDTQRRLVRETSGSQETAAADADRILRSLRRALRQQKMDLLEKARAASCGAAVTLSSRAVHVRDGPALTEAHGVLQVLTEGGQSTVLYDVLRKFTKQLHDEILVHAVHNGRDEGGLAMRPVTFQESEERSSSPMMASNQGSVKILEWEFRDEDDEETTTRATASPLAVWKERLAFIQRVLVFVADHALLGQPALCEIVGKRLLGSPSAMPSSLRLEELGLQSCRIGDDTGLLMEPLVEAMTETCLPSFLKPAEINGLEDQQKELEDMVSPFLAVMVESGLLPSTECHLEKFATTFVQQYVNNRRCQKLNQVRGLLMKSDYHNTVSVGEPHDPNDGLLGVKDGMSVFKLARAAVSEPAQRVMNICRECMDEAVEQAASRQNPESPLALLPATLYKTARECLDLYRAIIPVQYRTEIEQVPRTAAVFHNDCVYFAHHCQILGIEYKARFPPPSPKDNRSQVLHQTFIFVDMVPAFRTLAESAMRKMLDRQAMQIQELVGERITLLGKALRSDEILAEWSEAEEAVNAGLYHIRHLSQAWKPVLSYEVFHRCICFLADVMFKLLLDQIGKATDISTMACQFVDNLFARARDGVTEHLDGDFSSSQVHERFTTIGKCMDMTLNAIKVGLSKGVFRSVTGQELTRLIQATFDDSPKRRELLRLLTAHHGKV